MNKKLNPLLQLNSELDFSGVKAVNIKEAIEYYINKTESEIENLLKKENPTWDDAFTKLNKTEQEFNKVMNLIYHIKSVKKDEEIEEVYEQCIPMLVEHSSKIGQNKNLLEVYKLISKQKLSEERREIINRTLRSFKNSGIDLNIEEQKKFNEYSRELSILSNKYSKNISDSILDWSMNIKNKKDLEGLPESALDRLSYLAKEEGKEGYLIKLQHPYFSDVITYAKNRKLRKEVQKAYTTIASEFSSGNWDNKEVLENIIKLKNKKAKLLGYKDYVGLSLSTKMVNNVEQVLDLLEELKVKSKPKAIEELKLIKNYAKEKDGIEDLKSWDFAYYSELYKQETHKIDSEEIKKYFPLGKVKEGLFFLIEKLYGVKFKERKIENLYEENLFFYDLFNKNEEKIASVLMDLYSRDKKNSGAWMSDYQSKFLSDTNNDLPIAFVVCNFAKPTNNLPSLLSFGDVETLFHEMGHALHHMLTKVNDLESSGISGVPWDAVELPSQFMEYFCLEPLVLEKISSHYETGEVISGELLEKIKIEKNYMAATGMLRQIELSLIDLKCYSNPDRDPYELLAEIKAETSLLQTPEYNRFLNNFSHIFAGGYSAGYYGYKWADVLSADVYESFEENGVICEKTAEKFLDTILSKGGSKDINEMFKDFKGREPKIDALLKYSNLT